jgi:hypothetical protein
MFKSTFTPFLLATALLLMLMAACRKDKNQPPEEPIPDNPWGLPNATETGESTFGCLLDGKPWVAGIDPSIIVPGSWPLDMSYDETGTGRYYNNGWGMTGRRQPKDSFGEFIGISAYKFDKPGLLNWQNHKIRGTIFLRAPTPSGVASYRLDTLLPYRIEITKLDTLSNICSGRFEFFAVGSDKKDTIHVTEGRFDEIYAPE